MVAPETYSALVETLYHARLENRRLRIAHLRRMEQVAAICARDAMQNRIRPPSKCVRSCLRFMRFQNACKAEIARLRGEG